MINKMQWPSLVAQSEDVCSILVPQPGIEPISSALKVVSSHWTAREIPAHFFFFFNCLFLAVLSLCCFFSSCSEQRLLSRCNCWLLIVAFLVVEHGLQSLRASVVAALGLQSTDSVAVVPRLSCSVVYGIFAESGIRPMSAALAGRFFFTEPAGKPSFLF